MTDAVPVESTYYLFKQRLYRYQVENGVNLLDEIFRELTRGQSRQLGVIGDRLRMDAQTKHEWLTTLGELLVRLTHIYTVEHSPCYTLIERLLLEQYAFDGKGDVQRIVLKTANDVCADSLQSPHDEDATYHKKNDDKVREYNVHIAETCTEELNLILDVQVESVGAIGVG